MENKEKALTARENILCAMLSIVAAALVFGIWLVFQPFEATYIVECGGNEYVLDSREISIESSASSKYLPFLMFEHTAGGALVGMAVEEGFSKGQNPLITFHTNDGLEIATRDYKMKKFKGSKATYLKMLQKGNDGQGENKK